MADTFTYQLVFDTALRPGGAEAAERSVERVDAATSRSNRRALASDDQLRRSLSSTADKAKVSEFAFYDLDKAMARTTAQSQTFSTGATRVEGSSRNASSALLLFSQGFEDAQYGIRGVMNNIPGLVMAIGGTAGLAGAISIAAVAGSTLYEWFGKTEEKASDTAQKMQDLADRVVEVKSEKIADLTRGLQEAWDAAEALRQGYEETGKSADSYATAALSNAEKIHAAEMLIAEALGEQVDARKELESAAERDAEKRRLAAEQAIAAEQEKIAAAQDLQATTAAQLADTRQLLEVHTRELEIDKERLKSLKARKSELEAQAAFADVSKAILAAGPQGTIQERSQRAENLARQGQVAKEDLAANDYASLMQPLEERLKLLEDAVKGSGSQVKELTNQLNAATLDLQDQQAAVAVKVTEIRETLAADETLSDAQLAVDQGKALAAGMKDFVGNITAGNAQQAEAKKGIEAAINDGKVTADEMANLSRNLATLIGGLQSGLSTTTETTAAMLNQMRTFQSDMAILQREQAAMKAQYEAMRRSR